jgi:hypothetical protein
MHIALLLLFFNDDLRSSGTAGGSLDPTNRLGLDDASRRTVAHQAHIKRLAGLVLQGRATNIGNGLGMLFRV